MPSYKVDRQAIYFSTKDKGHQKSMIFYYKIKNGNTVKVTREVKKSDAINFLTVPRKLKCKAKFDKNNHTYTLDDAEVQLY
jgi:hypothetical protein